MLNRHHFLQHSTTASCLNKSRSWIKNIFFRLVLQIILKEICGGYPKLIRLTSKDFSSSIVGVDSVRVRRHGRAYKQKQTTYLRLPGFMQPNHQTHIPKARQLILAEVGRRRETIWDPCHRIRGWSLAGIKWEMVFSPPHFVLKLYTCTEDEIIIMSSLFQIPKWISWTNWISGTWSELSHSRTGKLDVMCKLFFLLLNTRLFNSSSTHCDRLTFFIPCIVTPKNWFKHQISIGDSDSKIPLCGSNHCISLFPNPQTSFVTSTFRRTESYFISNAFLF